MPKQSLGRLLQRLHPRFSDQPYERATLQDLHYCYRLLLRREPDPQGWAHWSDLILNRQIDLHMLVGNFLTSGEFISLQQKDFKPILVELDDFEMYVRTNDFAIGAVVARDKQYEPHVAAELRQRLEPGSAFVDIGANIGYFTLLGATLVGNEGRVIAFEPLPANQALIEQSIKVNGLENVVLHPFAVSDQRGSVMLEGGGADSNRRIVAISDELTAAEPSSALVETITLDEILAQERRIDVIKMDIEGAEPRAWKGMLKTIGRHRPILLFEFSPRMIRITSEVPPLSLLEHVSAAGYQIHVLPGQQQTEPGPALPSEILKRQSASGLTHLDLVAYPD